MKTGDCILWRWKASGSAYTKSYIVGLLNGCISLSDSKYGKPDSYLDMTELDIKESHE